MENKSFLYPRAAYCVVAKAAAESRAAPGMSVVTLQTLKNTKNHQRKLESLITFEMLWFSEVTEKR